MYKIANEKMCSLIWMNAEGYIPKTWTPYWRSMHRWQDNIKGTLKELEYANVDMTHLAQDRVQLSLLMKTAADLMAPFNARNFLTS
jgi:hypothetical protein